MPGNLTTHVLDTARGVPAAGVPIALFRISGGERALLAKATTNADGRTDAPILAGDALVPGVYELVFSVGAYLRGGEGPGFLDEIPVRFGVTDRGRHYHVPLLLSPFGYSTYRGS